jgi:hypothetical protein
VEQFKFYILKYNLFSKIIIILYFKYYVNTFKSFKNSKLKSYVIKYLKYSLINKNINVENNLEAVAKIVCTMSEQSN